MKTISAHARVTVSVEVSVGSGWGEKCDLAQVHKQAKDEALGKLTNLFIKERIRILGEPTVTAILVETEK